MEKKIRKNKKIKARLRIDGSREIIIEGKAKDFRRVFGRDEVLVEVTDIAPLWLTVEKVS